MLDIIYANKDSYEQGWGFCSHTHEYYQLLYVLSGEGVFVIDGQKKPFSKNDCLFIKPSQEHEFISEHKGNVTMFDMKFILKGNMVSYCEKLGNFFHIESDSFLRYLEGVYNEAIDKKPFYKEALNCRFQQAIIYILRQNFHENDEDEFFTDTSNFSEASKKLDEYLKNNYSKFISLDDIAIGIGYSKIYLCQIFKKDSGKTVMRYLFEMRLDKAKKLLTDTDDSLEIIAYNSGFRSLPHFNRAFSSRFKISPGKYRREQQMKMNLPILLADEYEQDLKTLHYISTDKK